MHKLREILFSIFFGGNGRTVEISQSLNSNQNVVWALQLFKQECVKTCPGRGNASFKDEFDCLRVLLLSSQFYELEWFFPLNHFTLFLALGLLVCTLSPIRLLFQFVIASMMPSQRSEASHFRYKIKLYCFDQINYLESQ